MSSLKLRVRGELLTLDKQQQASNPLHSTDRHYALLRVSRAHRDTEPTDPQFVAFVNPAYFVKSIRKPQRTFLTWLFVKNNTNSGVILTSDNHGIK